MIKISTIIVSLSALMLITSTPAQAQFGLPSLGGGSTSNADPGAIEKDLKEIIEQSSIGYSALYKAFGSVDEADKYAANAKCIKENTCSVKEAVEVMTSGSANLNKVVAAKMAAGEKLSAEATTKAANALIPAIKVVALWKKVIDGGKNMKGTDLMKFSALASALPQAPGALTGSLELYKSGIQYLFFSGYKGDGLNNALKDAMTANGIS